MDKTYDVDYEIEVICYNCKIGKKYKIRRGITTSEFRQGKICDNCGCKLNTGLKGQ